MAQVVVAVKPATSSAINWIAGLSTLGVTLNELLPIVPVKYQPYVTAVIAIIGGVSVIVRKTFYTTTITPASANTLSGGSNA